MKCINPRPPRGFSLIEILLIIAAIGVASTVAIPLITGVPDAAKKEKLEQDVAIVNNAIDAYLAAGGNPAALTQNGLLGALKSRVSGGVAAEMLGPQGPFLDPTVITNATDFGWSAVFTPGTNPRFVVAQTMDGVIFSQGPAMAVGGVAERPDEARPSWLWTYAEASPTATNEFFSPLAIDNVAAPTSLLLAGVTLGPPLVSPGSLTTNLWRFPLQVGITNTNPPGSSRVYYRVGSGNYALHDGIPLNIDPSTTLEALCVSLDPTRFYNSPVVTNMYGVVPLTLAVRIDAPSSITYAQAGGLLQGVDQLQPSQAYIRLEDSGNLIGGQPDNLLVSETGNDKFVPASYVRDANFVVRYTTDGSDPATSPTALTGPSFNGFYTPVAVDLALDAWGTNNVLPIRAQAVALNTEWFNTSLDVSNIITIAPTPLDPPSVLPTNQMVTFAVTVSMNTPVTGPTTGHFIRYTTNNSPPGPLNGSTYSAPFSLSSFSADETRTVRAVTLVSGNLTNWFSPSPETTRAYTGPAFAGSGFPSGALTGTATLNSTFNGNLTIAYPANGVIGNITYNANAVINGSLYVPGTPTVRRSSGTVWSPATDSAFATHINGIVEGQSPTPRVVDLGGPTTPTNYSITFNTTSRITGKIFRRIERYTLTPLNVANFPAKTSSRSVSLDTPPAGPISATNTANVTINTSRVGSVQLLPGTFGNMTANNGTSFILGNSNDTNNVSIYSFDSLTLNSGADLQIVGPVILNIRNGINLNTGSVLGNSEHPDWLQINVWNGNVSANSGSSIYGRLYVPNHSVSFNAGSVLNGSISAKNMTLNSSATVFSLSPAVSPGN